MRQALSFLAVLALLTCFGLLAIDFWRLFASEGQAAGLRLGSLIGQGGLADVQRWAALEGSTWGNLNRIIILPLMTRTPLWAVALVAAVVLWALRPAKNT